VTPPERLVKTFIFEGYPDVEVIETYEFEEVDGKTQSSMESGARETWERLTELLATLD
jgi:hypothetical protein